MRISVRVCFEDMDGFFDVLVVEERSGGRPDLSDLDLDFGCAWADVVLALDGRAIAPTGKVGVCIRVSDTGGGWCYVLDVGDWFHGDFFSIWRPLRFVHGLDSEIEHCKVPSQRCSLEHQDTECWINSEREHIDRK